MEHREYVDLVLPPDEKDTVWKPPNQHATNIVVYRGVMLRALKCSLDRGIDLEHELNAEIPTLQLIPPCRLSDIIRGFSPNVDRVQRDRRFVRIRSRTSAQGSPGSWSCS